MKKVIIIGGGIAGMTAGVFLQKAGFQSEIFEKNALPGGNCIGWNREGYHIDNCIHWLTGTKPGSGLYDLWLEIGALYDGIEIYKKEMFYSCKLNGQTITFWRDKERTRRELLELSPEDEVEINKLIDYTALSEGMNIPVEKPFDAMNPIELIKLGKSMYGMAKVMKEYKNMDVCDLAKRFKHPLIQQAITDYMPKYYQAYSFFASYGTITGENGDIPIGGSLAMSLRIAEKYKELGGVLHTNSCVEKIVLNDKKAEGILLENQTIVKADYVICACDTDFTFHKLLPEKYMPKGLQKMYKEREKYPVSSGFQVAYAIDGIFPELTGTKIFSCDEIIVGNKKENLITTFSYEYEPNYAPEGKMVLQSFFTQYEDDYNYWKNIYQDKEKYNKVKAEIAQKAMQSIIKEFPFLEDKIRIIDIWTPATYTRYFNAYNGAYMSFFITKKAKSIIVPGVIKDIDNVMLASQWLMGPGGLPSAVSMGKFAAWRIIKKNK